MSYGPPITRSGLLGAPGPRRNALLTRHQLRLLHGFGALSARGLGDRLVARGARRFIGGYLYALKLEINTACNLACPMCYVVRSGRELPRDVIERILGRVRGAGVRIELLGGEPLLRRDVAEIVASAKRGARSPFVSLYTNGTEATPAAARSLAEAGLDAAIVTLVSPERDTHDAFVRGRGAFDATLAGIRNLQAAGIATYTFTAVHRVNQDQCQALHAFVKRELGAHALFYQYVPRGAHDPLAVAPERWRAIKRWVLYEASPGHAAFVRDFYLLTGNACSGGNFVLTVKADGSVQPCPFIDDVPLGGAGMQDIWSIFARRYRGSALAELKSTPPECAGCTYESVCAGGCRAGNRAAFGTYLRRDARCLGPYSEPFDRKAVCDRVPCLF